MTFIKLLGMGKLIFATTAPTPYNAEISPDLIAIEGFIVDQRSVPGNFGVSDVKEQTWTVDSNDGSTAATKIVIADYAHAPAVGDTIIVRLNVDGTVYSSVTIQAVFYDTWVYENDDQTSYIQNKHNTATIVAQDWNTDNYINNGDTVTLGGLAEATDDGDYEVISITKPAGDTILVLKNIADENLTMTEEDPLTTSFTITKDIEVTGEAVGGDPASSIVYAKKNLITADSDLLLFSDGIIAEGEDIVIAGCTEASNNGTKQVASVTSNAGNSLIYIHNTDESDLVDEALAGTETITITKDIETDADGAVYFSNLEAIKVNYGQGNPLPEIANYIEAGEDIVLANWTTNDGTYTVADIDTTQDGYFYIHLNKALTPLVGSETETNPSTAKISITDDVVYENGDPLSEIIEKTSHIQIFGQDLTSSLDVGDEFILTGTTEPQDGTYTVKSITYVGGITSIVVTNAKQFLDGENFYTTTPGDVTVKFDLHFGIFNPLSSITATNQIDIIGGMAKGIATFLSGTDVITLAGTEFNNGTYNVTSVTPDTPAVGDVRIIVDEITLVNETLDAGTETITADNSLNTVDYTLNADSVDSTATALTDTFVFIHEQMHTYGGGTSVIPGCHFEIVGSSVYDGEYTVGTISYSGGLTGDTTIVVNEDIGTDGYIVERVPIAVTLDTPYKKYYAVAGDEIVKSKSTIKAPLVDLTAHPYINNTTLSDILLYDGDATYTPLTIESLTYDDDEGGPAPFTNIVVLEHLTAGDITGYSLVAPDRTLVLTNPRANSNVDAETRTIAIIGTLAELTEYINYFDIGTTFTMEHTTDGSNDGTYTISSIDISQIDVSDYRYGFTVEYDPDNILVDELSLPITAHLTIDDPFDIDISIGIDPSISVAKAQIKFYGRDITAHLLDTDPIVPQFELFGTTQDGIYHTTAWSGGADTIITIDEDVVGTLVNEALPATTSYLMVTPLTEYFRYTNASEESGIDILTYANIKWHGANLTDYLDANDVITLSRFGIAGNDGVKNIVDDINAVSWDPINGITTLWIEENLDAEILDDLVTPARITTEDVISCQVDVGTISSLEATSSTEYLAWADSDLTLIAPYFLTGDILDIYNEGEEVPFLTGMEIDTVSYVNGTNMYIVFTDTSALTPIYRYGISNNLVLVSQDKEVTYTLGADSAITTEIDRIIFDREIMPGEGVFTHDGFITLEMGDNIGTYAVGDFEYTDFDVTSSIVTPDTIIIVGEDLREYLKPGHKITLSGFLAVNNNGIFTIDTITYGAGDTTITTIEQTLTNETLNVGTETITKYGWTYGERGVGITEIILDPTEAWSLVDETLDVADTIAYNGFYTYTEANGTDSAITSSEDLLLLKGVVVTGAGADANLKEFLPGDIVQLNELSATVGGLNSEFDGIDLEIDTISDDATDTTITFVEDDNYSKWIHATKPYFKYELLTTGAAATGNITNEDETEEYIQINNNFNFLGATGTTEDTVILTYEDTVNPTTIKITNVETTTNVTNIQYISNDDPSPA